jgi:predicted amidophosphoribosyltransferase
MIASDNPMVRAHEAREVCEVCGNAAEYGSTHCPRCRKLTELATGGQSWAEAKLRDLMAMAAE